MMSSAPPDRAVKDVLADLDGALTRLETRGGNAESALCAFDADGTLWSGDVGLDLFDALLASGRVLEMAHAALIEETKEAGIEPGATALDTAKRLYDAFNAERYHEARAFAMMAWAFAGWEASEARAFVEDVLTRAGLEGRIQDEVRPLFAWAKERGVETVVVSASLRFAVEAGAARLGVPRSSVLAMTPAVADGRLLPRIEGPVTYGVGKVTALRTERPNKVLLGGFGDTSYDAAFLRHAEIAVGVRPKASLLARAAEVPHLVTLVP
jgi:phosphatidylglycerophosphatase C